MSNLFRGWQGKGRSAASSASLSASSSVFSLASLLVAASLLVSLSGCVELLVGGAVVGGAMTVSDRRTLGAQTEDTAIELKGGNRISSLFGDSVHVNVTSFNRKVLLTGEVRDAETRAKVGQEVAQIQNVASVVNELQVVPFSSSFSSRSKDVLLVGKVKAKLVDTPDIYSNTFKVVAESGVVFLMGRVTKREADTAVAVTRDVSGVAKVVKVFEYIDESELAKLKDKKD